MGGECLTSETLSLRPTFIEATSYNLYIHIIYIYIYIYIYFFKSIKKNERMEVPDMNILLLKTSWSLKTDIYLITDYFPGHTPWIPESVLDLSRARNSRANSNSGQDILGLMQRTTVSVTYCSKYTDDEEVDEEGDEESNSYSVDKMIHKSGSLVSDRREER